MIQDAKAFLRDLQNECVKEGEDYLNSFREELVKMRNNPIGCIGALLKILHSMKGNFQASAFLFYANYVHELESMLDKKCNLLKTALGKSMLESDVMDFELLMSHTIDAMQSYLEKLRIKLEDSENFLEERRDTLTAIEVWNPTFRDALVTDSGIMQIPIAEVIPVHHDSLDDDFFSVKSIVGPVSLGSTGQPEIPANTSIDHSKGDGLAVGKVAIEFASSESSGESHLANSGSGKSGDNNMNESGSDNEDRTQQLLFLLFLNSHKLFALEIDHVVEVLKAQPLSPPPYKRKNLCGLLNLRGEVLPILNVPQIEGEQVVKPLYIVVSQVDELRFGFQVESVHQVISLNDRDFQSVKGIDDPGGHVSTPRFCQLENKTVSILSAVEILFQLDDGLAA
jgi:chemotaxis signal transduction protein